ncbi:MAG: DUF1513 domain-containing protein [Chromatiales bacterium]|nr:DUF1513 domain-containing protein [Chromatiales bacterium]
MGKLPRRQFLRGLLAMGATGFLGKVSARAGEPPLYLSAADGADGRHYLLAFTPDGEIVFKTSLPGRGHAIAMRPDGGEALAVARRPGEWMLRVELRSGRILGEVVAAVGRHFYGHGVFSPDGGHFFVPENDYPGERGRIGVYAVREGYRKIADWDSGGIGPHELIYLPGDLLAVANGGLLTHPDSGRDVLNLDTMRSNLALIDGRSGQILERHELAPQWRLSSIRHLTALADGAVAVAMQTQADSRGHAPLVGLYRPGEGLQPLWAPQSVQRGLRDYCGSICGDSSGRFLAVSSPRGGRVCFWSDAGDYLGETALADGCGIAASGDVGEFVLSDGLGGLSRFDLAGTGIGVIHRGQGWRWDNHLSRLAAAG